MKKHLNNFPEHSISIESYNDLLNPCYDSILQLETGFWWLKRTGRAAWRLRFTDSLRTPRKGFHRSSAGWNC